MKPYPYVLLAIAGMFLITSCIPSPQTPEQLLALTPVTYTHAAHYECLYSASLKKAGGEGFLNRQEKTAWFYSPYTMVLIKDIDGNHSLIEFYRHPFHAGYKGNLLTQYLGTGSCESKKSIDFTNQNENTAKVFFYRVGDGKVLDGNQIDISEDSETIAELENYEYTWLEFDPGSQWQNQASLRP